LCLEVTWIEITLELTNASRRRGWTSITTKVVKH
jgi:hypothetical protein